MIRQRARGWLLEAVEALVLTVVIFLVLQTFIAQPFKVEGSSMEATVLPGQYVLIDKLTPHWAPYARGDIVVLTSPLNAGSNGVPFIKRVIGLPGDDVQLRDGTVSVNGAALDEAYLFAAGGVRQATEPAPGGASEWVVPQGDLLVMGDHRQVSDDSRTFGPIAISKVIGRAWLRYWPFDVFGILPTARYPAIGQASP